MANTYFHEQQQHSRAHTFWVDTMSTSWGRANAIHMRESAEAKFEHEQYQQEIFRLKQLGSNSHSNYEASQRTAKHEEVEARRLHAADVHNATIIGKLKEDLHISQNESAELHTHIQNENAAKYLCQTEAQSL